MKCEHFNIAYTLIIECINCAKTKFSYNNTILLFLSVNNIAAVNIKVHICKQKQFVIDIGRVMKNNFNELHEGY